MWLATGGQPQIGGPTPRRDPWAHASARFVATSTGEVRPATPFVSTERVYCLTELPVLLENTNVTTVNGMAREALVGLRDSLDSGAQAKLQGRLTTIKFYFLTIPTEKQHGLYQRIHY